MMRRSRIVFGAACSVALVVTASGCGKVKPEPEDLARCSPAEASTVALIGSSFDRSDRVAHRWQAVGSADGDLFVSTELVRPDDKADDRGDLATWIIRSAGGAPTSAEEHAADVSSLPSAFPEERFVETDGFLQSRSCVAQGRSRSFIEKLG